MAQIKEPYGLVYNTDGSLCATYRDDDIPFAGVRSFAVEEATTNLVNVYTLHANSGQYTVSTIERIDTPFGMKDVVKIMKTGTGSLFRFKRLYSPVSGEAVAITLFVKPINGLSQIIIAQNFGLTKSYTFATGDSHIKNDWHKITHKFIANQNNVEIFLDTYGPSVEGNQGCYVISQVESGKRYCTSYVDGSRSKGQLTIHLNLDVNNAVTNFWFKIGSIFELDSNGTRIIVFNGDIPAQNRFFIRADGYTNNATLKFYDSIDDAGPNLRSTMKNIDLVKWNMFTIVFDNGLIKIYLNENLLTQYTVSLNPIALKYLNIPEITPEFLKTGFWSNLYFGKYRKPDGTVIWTDDYIREVYEAKIPFPVQSQLSIY